MNRADAILFLLKDKNARQWTFAECDEHNLYPGMWRIEEAPGGRLIALAPDASTAQRIVVMHNEVQGFGAMPPRGRPLIEVLDDPAR